MEARGAAAALLPLAAMLLLASGVAGNSKHAAKLLMIEELRTAPAHKDVYAKLSKPQRSTWEYSDGRSINETLAAFTDIPVDITIDLKLVGFAGDGINRVNVHEPDLMKYLRALHMDVRTAVLEPELHHLAVRPRLHFRVTKASTALTHRIAGVMTSAAFAAKNAGATASHFSTLYLPYTTVDDVLAAEERSPGQADGAPPAHGASSAPATLTLYVLNLEPPVDTDYLYTYHEAPEVVAAGNWSDFHSCPGALHVSQSHHSIAAGASPRGAGYAWVDLSAAPNAYGPLRGGHGQVFPHSLPHAAGFQPSLVNIAILPELAALAASAVQHLAWQPLQHKTLPALRRLVKGDTLEIKLVHIHDTLGIPLRTVDASVLQSELGSVLAGSDLKLHITDAYISFAMCDVCVTAYTNALRVRTQRQEGSSVVATTGQILDRLVLHRTLVEYGEIIMAYAGVDDTASVLPVFVFDLSLRDEALLLDGALQAAAFPDMVVAVASRFGSYNTRFSCGHMPRNLRSNEVSRAVLGALLQTVFGVTHSALRYNPASGPGWNYLWALGLTPFGPLSALASVNSAQAGAVLRNLAAVELDKHAERIAAVLQGLARLAPSGKWPAALRRRDVRDRVHARVNVATLKAELAAAALGEGRWADALRMARQLSHEAHALERVAASLEERLLQKLECRGGTDWTTLLWPPAGSLLALAAAAWWRGRGARLRAEARYDKIY